jgi:uncharacterized protein with NAD-binding domain and iron-sulfur cluster
MNATRDDGSKKRAPDDGARSVRRPDGTPKRVVIVGGGCSGLAAAWELSKLGYDVSVYEGSGRLGGKGASSRALDGRILEHGLHVWLGFYENAFRMIRECYREVQQHDWGPHREEPNQRLAHATFEDAFFPEPNIGVSGTSEAGKTTIWTGFLPPAKGLPGDPLDPDSNPFTLASYLLRCVDLLKALMLSVVASPEEDVPGAPRPDGRSTLDEALDVDFTVDPDVVVERVAQKVREGSLTVAAALLHAVAILEKILEDSNHSPQIAGQALDLIRAVTTQVRKQLCDLVSLDEQLRWKTDVIDIVMTIMVGLYRDRVLLDDKGLDALNDIDYMDWLLKHGATQSAIESRFIAGIYDLVFAYEKGDRGRPRLAAGVALRGALRMFFTYRGAMFWRMRSGMGDAVFAPLYKVMSDPERPEPRKGDRPATVRFHFLHTLTEIGFEFASKEERFVTSLTFAAPAPDAKIATRDGGPLDHFGCWPESSGRISDEDAGQVVLNVYDDFDLVILATGLEGFAALVESTGLSLKKGRGKSTLPPAWQGAMMPGQTVGTRAAQVWLTKDLEELGWYRGSGIISALGLQYDTWADMTHTLRSEKAWRKSVPTRTAAPPGKKEASLDEARSVAYFCGVVPDTYEPSFSGDLETLLTGMKAIWPAFDAAIGSLASHAQANIVGTDRYSLSLPGTIRGRLSPLDRSVVNLTVAGDWTSCGLDAGCVEAAVMSGMLAAVAITGDETAIDAIIGYDHP